MVTPQILILLFWVRVLVLQQNNCLIWSTLLNGLKYKSHPQELKVTDNKVESTAT